MRKSSKSAGGEVGDTGKGAWPKAGYRAGTWKSTNFGGT